MNSNQIFQNIGSPPPQTLWYLQAPSGTETKVFLFIFDAFGCYCSLTHCFSNVHHRSSRLFWGWNRKNPTAPSKLCLNSLSAPKVPKDTASLCKILQKTPRRYSCEDGIGVWPLDGGFGVLAKGESDWVRLLAGRHNYSIMRGNKLCVS